MTTLERIAQHKLCYLATPYTRYKDGISMAHVEACKFTAGLIKCGIKVYSPIAHSHMVALYGSLDPVDHDLWKTVDQVFLELADALIVAELPGWLESKGVYNEIAYFDVVKKPIYYLPGDCFV